MDYKSYSFFLRASSMVCLLVFLCGLGLLYKLENERTLLSSGGTQRATAAETAPWWCEVRALFSWPCEDISVMDRESSKFSFGDQTAAVFNSANSLWCDFRDWLSWPCEDSTVDTVTPAPPRAPTPPVTLATTTDAFSESPVHVNKTEPTYVTNEYVTRPLEREILREVVIRDNNIDTSHFITRSDYDAQVSALLTSVEGSSSGASNALSDLSDSLAMSFTTDALTVSGSGSLSILSVGTTSAYDILTLDGMAYLAPVSAPTTTTNRLYNYDDNLYWSGNPIVGTLVGSWTSDGTHAWRPTGNVGIGTSSPSHLFTVAGDTNQTGALRFNGNAGTTGQILLSNGSSAPTWTATSSLGLGASFFQQNGNSFGTTATLGTNDAQNLVFETSGTARVTITSTGNVGIGTTSPDAKLEVAGDIDITSTFPTLNFMESDTADNNFRFQINGGKFNIQEVNDAKSVATDRLTIDTSGNVGIGTSTPRTKLDVDGNIYLTAGKQIQITGAPGGNGLQLLGNDSSESIIGTMGGNPLVFRTSSTERVRIDASGNVGIGTTSPLTKFTVTDNNANFEVSGNSNATYDGVVLQAIDRQGTGRDDLNLFTAGGSLKLFTASTERLRITNTGNVGIGTTSPAGTLHIMRPTGLSSTLILDTATAGNQVNLEFKDANTQKWAIYKTAGNDLNFYDYAGSKTPLVLQSTTGNVGIGTTSPTSALTVQTTSGAATSLLLANTSTGTTGYTQMGFQGTGRRYQLGVGNAGETTYGVADKFYLFDSTGGAMRMVVDTSGNVGIGTTNPGYKLDVAGGIRANGGTGSEIRNQGDSGYYSWYSTAGSRYGYMQASSGGIFLTAEAASGNRLGFSTNSAERMRIDSSGNVGIGTTTPVAKLSVSGGDIAMDQGVITNTQFPLYLQTNTANDIIFRTNTNQEKMRVTSSGNVGIGTTSPANKLDVYGSGATLARVSGGTIPGISIHSFAASGRDWRLEQSRTNVGQFSISDCSAGCAERLSINSLGNVGIGTTNPLTKLYVDVSGANAAIATFQGDSGGANQTSFVVEAADTGASGLAAKNILFRGESSTSDFAFAPASGLAATPSLVLKATGNVGIGTTSPAFKLDVNGTARFGDFTNGIDFGSGLMRFVGTAPHIYTSGYGAPLKINASAIYLNDASGGNVGIGTTSPTSKLSITQSAQTAAGGFRIATSDNADFRAMYMDSAGVFSFYGGDSAGTLNTATLNAAGEWTNASDRAYKERIEDLFYGLDAVMLLQPRSYVMRGTNQERIGFIAQEVELVLPELVSGEEGKKGISYGNMAAVIVKAIQDLYTFVLSQFKAQEQNNEEQEASIEALESRIRELEARQGISSPLEEAEEPDVDNSGVNTPIDLCLNLDGDQTELPTGFVINEESGECLEGEPTDEEAEPVDVTPVPILGCTDEEALNYDIAALEDDGSCDYEVAETTPEITAE